MYPFGCRVPIACDLSGEKSEVAIAARTLGLDVGGHVTSFFATLRVWAAVRTREMLLLLRGLSSFNCREA